MQTSPECSLRERWHWCCERALYRYLGGHVSVGPLTVFGRNAMHWAITYRTRRWGYVCVRLPLRCFGRGWPLYLYASPDATPQRATFMLGCCD